MTDYSREIGINMGKIPPNAIEFEKLVVGTMLIDSNGLDKAITFLGDDSAVFYDPRHKEIYRVILWLKSKNTPVDLMTVIQQLKKTNELGNAGGDGYLIDLTMGVSSSAHIEFHCRLIAEKFFQRKMIETCTTLILRAYRDDVDVFELLDNVSYETNKIYDVIAGQKPVRSIQDLHAELIQNIKQGLVRGVKIPFRRMDDSFMGWQPSDLIIVAARPAMGKSAYAMELSKSAAKSDYPTLVFSLEMANIQLHKRIVANELQIESDTIRKHKFTDEDLQKIMTANEFENMPLYFEDSIVQLEEILSKARVIKKEKGIKMIVIDYMQLIEAKGKSEGNEKVSYISRKLKQLAKELNVPVIALSQLSRNVETRPLKRPQLSDLRDSGAIEQDADVIQFIYRPEYYGIPRWDKDWDGVEDLPTDGEAEIITAKHRHCGTSRTRLKWNPDFQKFTDTDSNYYYNQNQNHNNVPTAEPNEAFPF